MIIQALLLVYNRPNLIRSQVGSVSTFWLYASVAYIFLNSFPNVHYFACFFLGRSSAFGLWVSSQFVQICFPWCGLIMKWCMSLAVNCTAACDQFDASVASIAPWSVSNILHRWGDPVQLTGHQIQDLTAVCCTTQEESCMSFLCSKFVWSLLPIWTCSFTVVWLVNRAADCGLNGWQRCWLGFSLVDSNADCFWLVDRVADCSFDWLTELLTVVWLVNRAADFGLNGWQRCYGFAWLTELLTVIWLVNRAAACSLNGWQRLVDRC